MTVADSSISGLPSPTNAILWPKLDPDFSKICLITSSPLPVIRLKNESPIKLIWQDMKVFKRLLGSIIILKNKLQKKKLVSYLFLPVNTNKHVAFITKIIQ